MSLQTAHTMRTFVFVMMALLARAQTTAPVRSPEIQSDGRVTFRFFDPHAETVVLHLEGLKDPIPMGKGADGLWSVTTEKLVPDLYNYSFEADGVHLLDPSNPNITPNLFYPSSYVIIPGDPPRPWEMTDIPHGVVHHHFYRSAAGHDNEDYYVYTPPAYDPNGQTRYPVLYLLHGYSDDASAWTTVGRANLILDSLIADGKAKPMIIVMPLGYGAPEIVQRTHPFGAPLHNAELREKNFRQFTAMLLDEILPGVEKSYRVATDRNSRAIAGLSMGGAESLLTGVNHLDQFSWVGSFSAGTFSEDFDTDFPQLGASSNAKLHLLWIACGTEDHFLDENRNLIAWLKAKDVRVTPIETPGMHSWTVWRRNLIAFASEIFRPRS